MENDIKRKRPQTPETKQKISNSQRMRFAKMKRALKENELRKLELKKDIDAVPLDDTELMLELRFQVNDEFNLFLDAMYDLFKHQLRMDRKKAKEQKVNEVLNKIDIGSVVDETIKNYLDECMIWSMLKIILIPHLMKD